MQRRCGYLADSQVGPERTVWFRQGVGTVRCPRSVITGESVRMVEEFAAGLERSPQWLTLPARTADGLVVLREERRRTGSE